MDQATATPTSTRETEPLADAVTASTTGRTDEADTLRNIDAATDAAERDAEPTMEQELRLLLPGHTYFKVDNGLPGPLQRLADATGAEIIGIDGSRVPTSVSAYYTCPAGLWMIAVRQCSADDQVFNVKIDGPDTEVEREHLSRDRVFALLLAVGAIDKLPETTSR